MNIPLNLGVPLYPEISAQLTIMSSFCQGRFGFAIAVRSERLATRLLDYYGTYFGEQGPPLGIQRGGCWSGRGIGA